MAGPQSVLIEAFEKRHKQTPAVFRAPGRVNLIGEHTDYNLGFVLPIAIDLACYAASSPNPDGLLRITSLNFEQSREWPLSRVKHALPAKDWSDYVIGVAQQLPHLSPCDVMIHSTVPVGSGLSSSAALEISSALAMGWSVRSPKLELAKLGQRAENSFVGMPCGILDQYVSVFGREGSAIRIDCRSLESEPVTLPENVAIVAVNSMVKHELGQSAYRERVAECALAAEEMGVKSLRDAQLDQLESVTDEVARKRARHVLSENDRVLRFVEACHAGDPGEMGRLFLESHRSLQHDYEVSCEELDFLVDSAVALPGVYGARMTGGGFGGCTVNLVDPTHVSPFETALRESYRARFAIEPVFYRVRPSAGASRES